MAIKISDRYDNLVSFRPYAVIIYPKANFRKGSWKPSFGYHATEKEYGSIVEDRDTGHRFKTFDEAVLFCVTCRNMGINEARYAAEFAWRIIKGNCERKD